MITKDHIGLVITAMGPINWDNAEKAAKALNRMAGFDGGYSAENVPASAVTPTTKEPLPVHTECDAEGCTCLCRACAQRRLNTLIGRER